MSDRERQDPLLDHLRQRVEHLRPATLHAPEHLRPVPDDLALPVAVGERCTRNVRHTAETLILAASANSREHPETTLTKLLGLCCGNFLK
jgi:hypothetical protein